MGPVLPFLPPALILSRSSPHASAGTHSIGAKDMSLKGNTVSRRRAKVLRYLASYGTGCNALLGDDCCVPLRHHAALCRASRTAGEPS